MLNYIIRRLLIGLVTLLGITFVTFLTVSYTHLTLPTKA